MGLPRDLSPAKTATDCPICSTASRRILRRLREAQLEGDNKGRHRDCVRLPMLYRHRALIGDQAPITELPVGGITRCFSDSNFGGKGLISKLAYFRFVLG